MRRTLLALACCCLWVGACDREAPLLPGAIDKTETEGPDLSDQRFLDRMSAHHQRAIALAALVPEGSSRPELLALAETIHRERSAELATLFEWGETWFRHRADGSMDQMAATIEITNRVRDAEDFDLAWMDAIEDSHDEGLEIARDAQLEADHREVRRFAESLVATHDAQLRQLRDWRATWYPAGIPAPRQ